MHLRLTDRAIRATCRELLAAGKPITGRQLRRALRERFQAVGKTERIFRIWREEGAATAADHPPIVGDAPDLPASCANAERAAADWKKRAEQAEAREEAHQDRWAAEVDQLRQALKAQPAYAAEIRSLQERVLRLSAELHAARGLLADLSGQP